MEPTPEALFHPYATRLDGFAHRHNLLVEKYRHDVAMWSFFFQHPLGGSGRIILQINKSKEVFLQKNWTLYLYDKSLRRSRDTNPERIDKPDDRLEAVVLAAIKDILGWELASLTDTAQVSMPAGVDPVKYPKVIFRESGKNSR
ncbi:MAG: hypothetical protein V4603_07830 [Pseudomonadota bacterium]